MEECQVLFGEVCIEDSSSLTPKYVVFFLLEASTSHKTLQPPADSSNMCSNALFGTWRVHISSKDHYEVLFVSDVVRLPSHCPTMPSFFPCKMGEHWLSKLGGQNEVARRRWFRLVCALLQRSWGTMWVGGWQYWVVVLCICLFSPRTLGKWSSLTNIFFKWVETTN